MQEQKLIQIRTFFQQRGLGTVNLREWEEKLQLPPGEMENLLDYLARQGAITKITEDFYLDGRIYQQCLEILKDYFQDHRAITLGQYRDLIKGSRKIAQTLLEHFDGCKYTKRVGDERVVWKMPL